MKAITSGYDKIDRKLRMDLNTKDSTYGKVGRLFVSDTPSNIKSISTYKEMRVQAGVGMVIASALVVIGILSLLKVTPALSLSTELSCVYIASGAVLLLSLPLLVKESMKRQETIQNKAKAPDEAGRYDSLLMMRSINRQRNITVLLMVIPLALTIIGILGLASCMKMPVIFGAVTLGVGVLSLAFLVKQYFHFYKGWNEMKKALFNVPTGQAMG